jgi:hypothetical protein
MEMEPRFYHALETIHGNKHYSWRWFGRACGVGIFVIAMPLFHTCPRSWPLALLVFVVVCGDCGDCVV